jgi:hypothetical protein
MASTAVGCHVPTDAPAGDKNIPIEVSTGWIQTTQTAIVDEHGEMTPLVGSAE